MGAITQFRIMGGAIGLAIATNVLDSSIKRHLLTVVSSQQLDGILQSPQSISTLDRGLQSTVRMIFGNGYNVQMKIMIGFGAAQVLASLLIWGKQAK